ncbi:dimethylarginine dimethylaminohydrolase family protein [Dongia soli]|uniref:Arginine deiminase-related protein n=1 Tax=Dongia soli TaxID=600628 RepID=A0ABU5E5F5_9PROT|nr:arginine deiminase-related protein [Dongia soli]MDY0881545.1 arginine deiminase-related protein [Dongia soli]
MMPRTVAPRLKTLDRPALLMNLPLSLATDEPNNILMQQMSDAERLIDHRKALHQFTELYHFLAQRAVVYLLPSTPKLQDQAYVANLGIVLPHLRDETVVVSRFRSTPRLAEAPVGIDFFNLMHFHVHLPPERGADGEALYFEGEADLKYLRDDIYIGAHGLRTSLNALAWFSQSFGMKIIPYRIADEYLYHLDCCLFVIDAENVILCRDRTNEVTLRAIERECNVVEASVENVRSGLTNSLIIGQYLLCDSPISEISRTHDYYESEKAKIARLEEISVQHGLELRIFNLSEFMKSGAALSCLAMRLNHVRG